MVSEGQGGPSKTRDPPPLVFSLRGQTSAWEAGKNKWEAGEQSGVICEGFAGRQLEVSCFGLPGDSTVLFPLPEQVSPGAWLSTPAQSKATHRGLCIRSASCHDGHQQLLET